MNEEKKTKRNPSRETCESIIRRILMTELAEKGTNEHFKQPSDFMGYFESLYPASDSLAKQVQRALKAMNLPKDEHGYFIINKSREQIAQEADLKDLTKKEGIILDDMEHCQTVFIRTSEGVSDYLIHKLCALESLQDKYITMVKTCNGVLIYTYNKSEIISILKNIIYN